METLSLLWGTVLLRPYVFLFLAVYLTIAILNMGVLRSLFFTVLAYSIAFLCEYIFNPEWLSFRILYLYRYHKGSGIVDQQCPLYGFPFLLLPNLCELYVKLAFMGTAY